MRSLSGLARRPQKDAGHFLRQVFPAFEQNGMRLRSGTVTYIAGVAGAMKTGLTLYWVSRLGVPVLYFSADSEPFEMLERAAAMVTGDPMTAVRANPQKYADVLEDLDIRMVFDDSPSYDDVVMEVAAFAEVYGDFPAVIVIDNLLNLTGENEDEWGAYRDHARVLHKLTRITKAAVIVLAHMGEDKADPTRKPPPRNKLQGKTSQLPKLIIGLAFDGQVLKAAPLKTRWGRADPSGETFVEVYANPGTNQFFNSFADLQQGRVA